MPQQLEYDEQGSTFYYFLISFYGLFLFPATYFLWPSRKKAAGETGLVCQCDPCRHKRVRLEEEQPRETLWFIMRVAVIAVLWLLLVFMLYKVLTAEVSYEEYDPFSILELDSDATTAEIKKQYRRLSKVYHPDKQGGDQDMFMKIAKAYEALTDEVSRENWIKYGNPDGPQAATFGIALPSWVVEKQNSIWVLGLYMLVFIVILPIAVGTWWYRSIKYTTANLLIQTSQVFFHFLSKPRQLTIKRLLMVMAAAFEFNPQYSKLLPPRPSDDEELNELIHSRDLPHLTVKVKEPVLREPWAVKTSILIHTHLGKVGLPPATLRPDQKTVLKLCPRLINEMMNILNQVWIYARYRPSPQVSTPPSQDVYESVMRISQMVVQQMWDRESVMLQLPHIQTDMLRHFRTRRRNIITIEEFVAMKNADRRSLVRAISDEDYLDVMAVCSSFPHVTISTETQGIPIRAHHHKPTHYNIKKTVPMVNEFLYH
jgi:translocation protein SEC63